MEQFRSKKCEKCQRNRHQKSFQKESLICKYCDGSRLEAEREYHRDYYRTHPKRRENFKSYCREYYLKNTERLKKRAREWAIRNPDKLKKYAQTQREKRNIAMKLAREMGLFDKKRGGENPL